MRALTMVVVPLGLALLGSCQVHSPSITDLSAAPTAGAGPIASSVSVEIVPDRTEFREGEPLTGRFILRNRSDRTIVFPTRWAPPVEVRQADGTTAPSVRARTFICGGSGAGPEPVAISPGNRYEQSFGINTDPLSDYGGVRLVPGRYELSYPDLSLSLGIRTQVRPVAVTVRPHPDHRVGGRIINFGAGGGRLNVLRESGLVESFDLATGDRRASVQIEGYQKGDLWHTAEAFSPDGARLAYLRQADEVRDGPALLIYRLDEPGRPALEAQIPPAGSWPRAVLRQFDAASRSVSVINDAGLVRIDSESGQAEVLTTAGMGPDQLSADGRYILRSTSAGLTAESIGDGPPKPFSYPGGPTKLRFLSIPPGVILACEGADTVFVAGNDGQTLCHIQTAACDPAAASQEGRYVALRTVPWYGYSLTRKAGSLEVWDTSAETPKRVLHLKDDEYRTPVITGTPPLLVCARTRMREYPTTWFDDTFEVYELPSGRLLRTLVLAPAP